MTERHAPYATRSPAQRDGGLEPLAEILHRFVEQEHWPSRLEREQATGHTHPSARTTGHRHG